MSLETLAQQIKSCTRCDLYLSRTHAVPGDGYPQADIMLIGEAPGFNEDAQGYPFVGQSGRFLNQLLALAHLSRGDIWITNVVKCRPPGNRDPRPIEIETCTSNYLWHQIRLVNPHIVITLGRFSMALFVDAKISQIHGQMRLVKDRYIICMYHPGAALHRSDLKPVIEADFARLPGLLDKARLAQRNRNGQTP